MKAVVTVIGKDKVGIIAKTSAVCARHGANIVDISQTVLDGYFTMIMLVEIDNIQVAFNEFVTAMAEEGKTLGVEIRVMHEDIFDSMHRI